MTALSATCSKCNGSGSYPPLTRQVCRYCKGKRIVELPTYRTAGLGQVYVARARKDHLCALCEYVIPKGDHHWTWSLAPWMAGDFDAWYVGRAHAVCEVIYTASDWHRYEDSLPDPGDFRSELLANVLSAERDHVEWAEGWVG